VLDNIVEGEAHTVALSKQLASSFLIRGAQLSVVRRIDSQYIVQIQTNLLTWIGKRLATYENNKNKKSRKIAITFFRVLIPMLATLDSRDALKIKAHMDQVLAQAKVEVLATSKQWEPQRAYEKRLGNVMSKDKAPKAKGRKSKTSKNAAVVTSDEDEESEVEGLMEATQTTAPPARPRPRPAYRSAAPAEDQDHVTETDDENHDEVVGSDLHVTPQGRTRVIATYGSIKSPSKSPSKKSQPAVNGTSNAQKRQRDEEESATDEGGSPARGTQSSDIQVRRKRVRH